MVRLHLSQDKKTILPFEVREESAMLKVKTNGTLQVFVSVDCASWNLRNIVQVSGCIHQRIDNLVPGCFMKITSDNTMSNPKIIF